MDATPQKTVNLLPIARVGDRVRWTPPQGTPRNGTIVGFNLEDENEIGVVLDGETAARFLPQGELHLFISTRPRRRDLTWVE